MRSCESHLIGELEQAATFLIREARHLDKHEWDAWVAMYREDAVYWLPAWRDEYETTTDPQTEVSLIFHNTRLGLEERIARIESRKSITALPLPRTLHQISNVELRAVSPAHIETEASPKPKTLENCRLSRPLSRSAINTHNECSCFSFLPEKWVGLAQADPNDHHGFATATPALRGLAMA